MGRLSTPKTCLITRSRRVQHTIFFRYETKRTCQRIKINCNWFLYFAFGNSGWTVLPPTGSCVSGPFPLMQVSLSSTKLLKSADGLEVFRVVEIEPCRNICCVFQFGAADNNMRFTKKSIDKIQKTSPILLTSLFCRGRTRLNRPKHTRIGVF